MFFWKKPRIPHHPRKQPKYDLPLTAASLEQVFSGAADFIHRTVLLGDGGQVEVFFLDGLVSGDTISESVIRPLANGILLDGRVRQAEQVNRMEQGGVYNAVVERRNTVDEVASDLVNGYCVVLFQQQKTALSFETKTQEKRSISEPTTENVVKGAKDAFVETLRTNTSLVRRHVRTPDLRLREQLVGRQTMTRVSLVYLEGLTNPALITEAEKRLEAIDVDAVLAGAALEEYLVDRLYTPFPLLLYTERTDRFSAGLMDGRVGLFIDGLPMGYLFPATLSQFMIAPEDRAGNFMQGTVLRIIRYLALWVNLLMPGFYLAVSTFHQEMIPTALLRSMIESKQDVPFPTVFEVLGLLLAFEILQEAGLRLPKTIGQTVSIIGGLVVGQAAVDAKILSPVVIIVVAVTGIAGYTLPNRDFAGAIRIWRFLIAAASAVLGLFGTAAAGIALLYHLCDLENFSVPYLAPYVARGTGGDGGSGILRPPFPHVKERESYLRPKNVRRRK